MPGATTAIEQFQQRLRVALAYARRQGISEGVVAGEIDIARGALREGGLEMAIDEFRAGEPGDEDEVIVPPLSEVFHALGDDRTEQHVSLDESDAVRDVRMVYPACGRGGGHREHHLSAREDVSAGRRPCGLCEDQGLL